MLAACGMFTRTLPRFVVPLNAGDDPNQARLIALGPAEASTCPGAGAPAALVNESCPTSAGAPLFAVMETPTARLSTWTPPESASESGSRAAAPGPAAITLADKVPP